MVGYLFGGNTGLTYQDLQSRREAADALAKRIMGMQPKNVPEGIGALLMGAASGIGRYRADKALGEGRAAASTQFDSILGRILGGGNAAATGQPTATGSMMPKVNDDGSMRVTSSTPPDVSNNGSTFSPFIDTVKAGGLTNPYGLAAVAATGRAESGWSPKKAGGSWADPSESGEQGTSGGVMSWRAERLQNLRNFAASKGEEGNGSPQTQAEFFMKEDPQLVAKLNSAKSPEEAADLMANAWRFAGYNRPGGEAARRRSYASAYLPTFAGQGQEVASLDPSVGMPPAAAAIERQASASGYVDPKVSAPNYNPTAPNPGAMPTTETASSGGQVLPAVEMGADMQPQAFLPPQQTGTALPPLPSRDVSAAPPVASVPPQQVAQAGPPQMPRVQPYRPDPEMLKLLSNPFLDDGQKAALRMVMQQQMQEAAAAQEEQTWRARQDYERQQRQGDPRYQQELQLGQIQIDQAKGPKYTYTTLPDGTVLRTDPRGGAPEKVYESAPKPTANMQDYETYASEERAAGRVPLGRLQYQQEIKKAGASNTTNIVGGEGDKFFENLDKKNAETFAAMSDAGMQARGRLGQIDRLESIFANVPQGAEGAFKKLAGDWGVPIGEGTSDIQAASALLEKMVPEQRLPGSGTMSDGDIKMFRASLPRIINQPGGNQLIFQTMRGIAQYEQQMGEIADAVADRAITPAEGRQRIRQLKNPLADYKVPEGSTPNGGFKTRTGVQWSVE